MKQNTKWLLIAGLFLAGCSKEYVGQNSYGVLNNSDYYFEFQSDSGDRFEMTSNLSVVQGLPFDPIGKMGATITQDSGRLITVQVIDTAKKAWFYCSFQLPKLKAGDSFSLDSQAYFRGVYSNFILKNRTSTFDAFTSSQVKNYKVHNVWPKMVFKIVNLGDAYPVYNSNSQTYENIQDVTLTATGTMVKQSGSRFVNRVVNLSCRIPIVMN